MSRATELARQQAVLAACRTPCDASAPWDATQACWPALTAARLHTDAAGLRAYQLNADATAQRVVAAHFPTLQAMLGKEALDTLARMLWREAPPGSGDLGEWGGALPGLIERLRDLQAWPWLADFARLEWARQRCERAADAQLAASSLSWLAEAEPDQLYMALKPCVQLVDASWPVLALWQAHQGPVDTHEDAARRALQEASAALTQAVVVWRNPSQLQMAAVPAADAVWMRRLIEQPAQPLSALLAQAPEGFDFSLWLHQAVSQGWLWRVSTAADHA